MNPFAGKVAVVTGGASGIGKAICEYLGRQGATVIVVDRNPEGAGRVEGAIVASAGRAEAVGVDVANEEEVERLIESVRERHGRLDYLFNNAGVSVNGEFLDISAEHWKRIIDVNFWGVIYGCRYAYPIMVRQGSGHIINTASLAGLIPGGLTTSYSASKHAVVGFSLTLRPEARLYGVRVSALCPGFILTGIQKSTPNVSEYLNSEENRRMRVRMRAPTADDCIDQIMRGVRRNKGIIFTPNRQRIYWWLHRLSPEFMPNMFTRIIARLRRSA